MEHSTQIDTVGIQIDFYACTLQREILYELLSFIAETGSLYVQHKDYFVGVNGQYREYYIYSPTRTIIATINTGISRERSKFNNGYINKCYIAIKFAGLKQYNEILDKASYDGLMMVCAYLNTKSIGFKFTELDICIDAECKFENILAVCTQKAAATKYYGLTDVQAYASTTYIEKIAKKKLYRAVRRAYVYDKTLKEGLDSYITRFEIKLQPKFFNKNELNTKAIEKVLNRYHVMYFKNTDEKNNKIQAYSQYSNPRQREIKKLGFNNYRLYPDMDAINNFINQLLHVNYIGIKCDI